MFLIFIETTGCGLSVESMEIAGVLLMLYSHCSGGAVGGARKLAV